MRTCDSGDGTFDCSVSSSSVGEVGCSGHGDGTLIGPSGSSQERAQQTVSCTSCDSGWAGATCAIECPVDDDVICSVRGVCDEGPFGTGKCSCSVAGYGGPACDQLCCNGHGTTDESTCSGLGDGVSGCACERGFAGSGKDACKLDQRPIAPPSVNVTSWTNGDVATLALEWETTVR